MHERYMRRALELAESGRGAVHPNPLVGAVLVRDGRILAEGFHRRFGGAHAEIEAIEEARRHGGNGACRDATLYVTLEPCAHQGKTPPCVDAILEAGIAEVVYAVEDPNPLVGGKGQDRLQSAGVRVKSGIEAAAARRLNEAFFHFHTRGRPFVTWKVARSLLGETTLAEGRRTKLTDCNADANVDEMRARADAVVIGSATAVIDDPGLRVREATGRDPWRVVLDARLRTPPSARLVRQNTDRRTLLITTVPATDPRRLALEDTGVAIEEVAATDGGVDLAAALAVLGTRGLIDLLVESGGRLGRALLERGLVDRVITFATPVWAPGSSGRIAGFDRVGADIRIVWEPR
jgi:diaminohydroxyphosphoribosylaminopyrimidine deaminase/5-amino-6-(5-phosphoribosylamino)uracil reductase